MAHIKVVYECGCKAEGDNISNFCPMHQSPIAEKHIYYSKNENKIKLEK